MVSRFSPTRPAPPTRAPPPKLKWNSDWGRAWRKAYNASPKGRAARARHYGTELFWTTLRRWRNANRELVRSYEHACRDRYRGNFERDRYRGNLELAQAALAASAAPATLPDAQKRALARRAAEEKREGKRSEVRKEDRASLKVALAGRSRGGGSHPRPAPDPPEEHAAEEQAPHPRCPGGRGAGCPQRWAGYHASPAGSDCET